MADLELLTAGDVRLMQALAQRLTADRLELLHAETTFGELAWNWGKAHSTQGSTWPRRLWFADGELVAWAWARLPYRLRRGDGSVRDVTGASLVYLVDPAHAKLLDEVIDWYEATTPGLARAVVPSSADTFALERWAARGYTADPASLGDTGDWSQLNERQLTELEEPVLPPGFRFTDAEQAGPEATVQAHLNGWPGSAFTLGAYQDLRRTPPYRADLHVIVEAPDGTAAASAIMWLDEANRTVEFEPVSTHPDFRRRGLAHAMLLHGMHRARAAGAVHATVACAGAPGLPAARSLYQGLGFRELSRDMPLLKPAATAA